MRKSTTFIIFNRSCGAPDDDDGDEGEDEDAAPAAAKPKPKAKPVDLSPLPSHPSQPRGLHACAGRRRPTHACGDAYSEAAGSGRGHRAEKAGLQRAQRVWRLSARFLQGPRSNVRTVLEHSVLTPLQRGVRTF